MSWRLHLSNQAIARLSILQRPDPILLAFTRPDRLFMIDLETGTPLHEGEIALPPAPPPPIGAAWARYFEDLRDLDDSFLPRVTARRGLDVYQTEGGEWRLLMNGAGALGWPDGARFNILRPYEAERWLAVDFEPSEGLWCALDEQGRRHLYLRDALLNVSGEGKVQTSGDVLGLALARDGRTFAFDGQQVLAWSRSGDLLLRLTLPYRANRMAVPRSGDRFLLSDRENGVLRLYRSSGGMLTHQKTAIDLMAQAVSVQLISDLPPLGAAVNSLAMSSQGWIAFSLMGVIAAVHLSEMDSVIQGVSL